MAERTLKLRGVLAAIVIVVVLLVWRHGVPAPHWPWTPAPARVTQDLVMVQIQNVAKLVSTELTLRDVVTYDQTRFTMRRRALFVVTGKVLAGIDLTKDVHVHVDDAAERISITLPRAEILSVEVLNTRTYDETAPLFFGFQPPERDSIQGLIRAQLRTTGEQSGLLQQADKSARQFLQTLLARDGYTVDVTTRTELAPPASARQ
jgi:hypothetical protein